MSTKHTANIFIKNNTDGNAQIQMTHQYSDTTPDTGSWSASPGQTVGPLTVHFETGFGTGLDWWWIVLTVKDGATPGIYTSGGSIIAPNRKECMLRGSDSGQNITNIVDTRNFNINLKSGACSTGMSKVAPYSPITNVFVVMLENHSFDHLLGYSAITGTDAVSHQPTQINGPSGSETNVFTNSQKQQQTCQVSENGQESMTTDPGHEFLDTLEQLCGAGTPNPYTPGQPNTNVKYPAIDNSGFAANYSTTTTEGKTLPTDAHVGDIMACVNPPQYVNALYTLAKEFAVCDNWYCSMPGPTWPNRFFAMGASSSGLDSSPTKTQMAKWFGPSGFKYKNGSIFDLIKKHGMQYRLYNDHSNQFSGGISLGGQIPIVASLKGITVFDVHDLKDLPGDLNSGYPYTYTFIEPNYGDIVFNNYKGGSSQHPMDSLAAGDALVAYVYNAIRNSPVWNTSLLVITYDEHGGFYDHTVPPAAVSPGDNPDYGLNVYGFNFEQLGVRVPAVIVSPLIATNTIDHTVYDHTSILKTLEGLFSMPSLTARDAAANDLRHLLSASAPRTDSPESIALMTGASAPSAEPASALAQISAMDNPVADMEPLPEEGNVFGFLQAAVKADVDLSTSEAEKQAAIARFEQIKTKGDAKEYLSEVAAKIDAAKAAQKKS